MIRDRGAAISGLTSTMVEQLVAFVHSLLPRVYDSSFGAFGVADGPEPAREPHAQQALLPLSTRDIPRYSIVH